MPALILSAIFLVRDSSRPNERGDEIEAHVFVYRLPARQCYSSSITIESGLRRDYIVDTISSRSHPKYDVQTPSGFVDAHRVITPPRPWLALSVARQCCVIAFDLFCCVHQLLVS